jgi:hypothetical protein
MPGTLTIEGKQLGKSRDLFESYTLPAPETDGAITLRDLIAHVVRCEVTLFNERAERRKLVQTLTRKQIDLGAEAGRIVSGGREEDENTADADASIEVALLAFTDGLFFVFVDDEQRETLDDTINIGQDTRLTFLRLVALAGG